MNWFIFGLKNYVNFSGRAHRREYWMFFLFSLILSVVLSVLDGIFRTGGVLSALFALGTLLPSFAVAVRRLHDTDRSGWWSLIMLVPVVGLIILVVFLAMEGTSGPNRFGAESQVVMA